MYLSVYADLHNYDKNLILEHFYHPPRNSYPIYSDSPLQHPQC